MGSANVASLELQVNVHKVKQLQTQVPHVKVYATGHDLTGLKGSEVRFGADGFGAEHSRAEPSTWDRFTYLGENGPQYDGQNERRRGLAHCHCY